MTLEDIVSDNFLIFVLTVFGIILTILSGVLPFFKKHLEVSRI